VLQESFHPAARASQTLTDPGSPALELGITLILLGDPILWAPPSS